MKTGLKLWSINTDFYYEEAKRLFKEGWFDYIELYVVPDTLDTLPIWKTLCNDGIPFTLHAAHFVHGVNLADKLKENFNFKIFGQVKEFFTELNADYIIVHSGIEGNINETVRQLKIINFPEILIENKPFFSSLKSSTQCVGTTIDEISWAIEFGGVGFCLDVSHAICAYNGFKDTLTPSQLKTYSSPYEYLKEFNKLKPICYHLSDGFIESGFDQHLNLQEGDYNFQNIFDIIDTNKKIVLETKKNNSKNLNDFISDIKILRKFR